MAAAGNPTRPVYRMPRVAIVRDVPDSYSRCLLRASPRPEIDVRLARSQHSAYVEQLDMYGVEVVRLPADERFPDSPFVEDTFVILRDVALACRLAEPTRQGEVEGVVAEVAKYRKVEHVEAPAVLEGGDVLAIGETLFVGVGGRTNEAGAAALEKAAAREGKKVVRVPLTGGALHLKSVVNAVRPGLLAGAKGCFDPKLFAGHEFVWVDEKERAGANLLPILAAVYVTHAAPRLEDALRHRGVSTIQFEISEFEKGDGGLTCLSLRID